MCPNSESGAHNFQLKTVSTDPVVIVRVCILCNAEG